MLARSAGLALECPLAKGPPMALKRLRRGSRPWPHSIGNGGRRCTRWKARTGLIRASALPAIAPIAASPDMAEFIRRRIAYARD